MHGRLLVHSCKKAREIVLGWDISKGLLAIPPYRPAFTHDAHLLMWQLAACTGHLLACKSTAHVHPCPALPHVRCRVAPQAHSSAVSCVAVSAAGDVVASGSVRGCVLLWRPPKDAT
jgi:hypothetical protein